MSEAKPNQNMKTGTLFILSNVQYRLCMLLPVDLAKTSAQFEQIPRYALR